MEQQETAVTTADKALDVDMATIWETVNNMIEYFVALLPKLALGIVVLIIFWLVPKLVRRFAERDSRYRHNGGVAIGFAFKDILQNFLAGILILVRHPFRVGDEITSGSFTGTVESIETQATFIKTYNDQRIIVPNS